ncbi:XRE family transcriptional regulator [Clostridiaceae bacterium M8S5]|nr:XRE family transcriptional regulator [Clostridiaceae bacterium M8S5]
MNIGNKIKSLRTKYGLTQEELADRSELSKGFISQVERDLTSPSIATLVDILESLGTNLKEFFNESIEEKIVFKKEDYFIKMDEDLNYEIQWIVPNAQKNMMEPILLELKENGRSNIDYPHEGEEFGYVLAGTIIVHLDKERYTVKKGECFYFKAGVDHYISNKGKTKAKVLWINTPPNF